MNLPRGVAACAICKSKDSLTVVTEAVVKGVAYKIRCKKCDVSTPRTMLLSQSVKSWDLINEVKRGSKSDD